MLITVNRAPVLTLWGAVVAERLGHPPHTALTLGRAVAGAAARVKARNIGRQERRPENAKLVEVHVTAPVLLLGKTIRLLPTEDGELRAADGDLPADADAVARYLTKAFGEHLERVKAAMVALAARYEPQEVNRIGFRLYEAFRPDVPSGAEGWEAKAVLEIEKILPRDRQPIGS